MDMHCYTFLSTFGQTHVNNFARGSFIFNEDIDNLIPYTIYKLSLVMLKREKLFGLPKTYCTYLLLYIKLDDMLISTHFESRAFPVHIMIYELDLFAGKVFKEETDIY